MGNRKMMPLLYYSKSGWFKPSKWKSREECGAEIDTDRNDASDKQYDRSLTKILPKRLNSIIAN